MALSQVQVCVRGNESDVEDLKAVEVHEMKLAAAVALARERYRYLPGFTESFEVRVARCPGIRHPERLAPRSRRAKNTIVPERPR